MSTRSNVCLKLREEDKNADLKTPWGDTINPQGLGYLQTYIHFDGYIEGVGLDLIHSDEIKTYEDALNWILEGHRPTIDESYYNWRGEEISPQIVETPSWDEEYLYVLEEDENGKIIPYVCIDTYNEEHYYKVSDMLKLFDEMGSYNDHTFNVLIKKYPKKDFN